MKKILERDSYKCIFCGEEEDLQVHHLKPRSQGGTNNESNLITLCSYCHWYLHANPKLKIHHSKLVKNGLNKAKAKGKQIGRPKTVTVCKHSVIKLKQKGFSLRNIAKELNTSLGTIQRIINKEV